MGLGIGFGFAVLVAMFALYHVWLKPAAFFDGPREQVVEKISDLGIDTLWKYAASRCVLCAGAFAAGRILLAVVCFSTIAIIDVTWLGDRDFERWVYDSPRDLAEDVFWGGNRQRPIFSRCP